MFVKGFDREYNNMLHKNKDKENNWRSKHWTSIPTYVLQLIVTSERQTSRSLR